MTDARGSAWVGVVPVALALVGCSAAPTEPPTPSPVASVTIGAEPTIDADLAAAELAAACGAVDEVEQLARLLGILRDEALTEDYERWLHAVVPVGGQLIAVEGALDRLPDQERFRLWREHAVAMYEAVRETLQTYGEAYDEGSLAFDDPAKLEEGNEAWQHAARVREQLPSRQLAQGFPRGC